MSFFRIYTWIVPPPPNPLPPGEGKTDSVSGFKNYLISFLAGACLVLAFAPYDLWIIGIISPAVLFYLWHNATPKHACLTGYLYGLGMFGVGVNWLHISINLFGGVNLVGAYVITYSLVAFLALYPALTGFLCRKYFSQNILLCLLLIMPVMWMLAEWFRSWIFTGFPWLNLGYSQTETWLAGLAPVSGVYGLSWLTAVCAALITFIFITNGKQKILALIILALVAGASFSINRIQWTVPDPETKTVALIQAAIPQEEKWKPETQQYTIDLYTALSNPYWGEADFIIWPETAIPMFYHQALPLIEVMRNKAINYKTGFLSGVPVQNRESRRYYNSILALDGEEEIYHKRHLVPFGEYLPFDSWIRPILDSLRIPMSSFSPGSGKPLLHVAGIPVGVSICYEDVFGEEVIDALPEATLLVNISNDAWFGDSLAPHQHLQMARMRAKETGRYMLRATNTGISAIIDEKGKIMDQSPQFTPHALYGNIKTFTGVTPYSVYGNYLVVIPGLLVVFVYLLIYLKMKLK